MSQPVFHVVLWTEGADINFELGLEGAIALRADADRLAQAYQAVRPVGAGCQLRVGVLELPAPHPDLDHPSPLTTIAVEAVIAQLYAFYGATKAP